MTYLNLVYTVKKLCFLRPFTQFLLKSYTKWVLNILCKKTYLHKMYKKSTPNQIMMYQISLLLFKTVNETCHVPSGSFTKLMDQIVCTGRQIMFETHRSNKSKIGMNSLSNRLYLLNNKMLIIQKCKEITLRIRMIQKVSLK